MEVINSTNIVFDNRTGRESKEATETFKMSKPFRKMKSPKGSRLSKPSRSPWTGISGHTPIKGRQLDSPVNRSSEFSVLPPTPAFESPKLSETPLKRMESTSLLSVEETTSPIKERKRMSPSDSGIELPKLLAYDSPLSVSPSKINPKIRAMYNASRRDFEETSDFTINPDPVPYQPSNFMSSTVLKKIPLPRRHLDTFDLTSPTGKRGVILHTDRYQWDLARALDGMSQRERLQAELDYMEKLRGIKRRTEVLPHRAQLDLLMGGKKIEYTERFDIQREIQKLRSLILPQNARDLYHGRGIPLPSEHNSVHPRRPLPPDIDSEELQEAFQTFPASKYTFDPETGRAKTKISKRGHVDTSILPKLSNKGYLLGHGQPIILSKEKRTVASLKARLYIPTRSTKPAYLQRSRTNIVPLKQGSRSFTAILTDNKDRPQAATAPVAKAVPRDIKIPVSSREDTDMLSDFPPKPPPPTAAAEKKPDVEEETELQRIAEDKESRMSVQKESRARSRQSTQGRSTVSPTKAPTPNPLKGSELPAAMSAEEQNKLKQTFKKLDTDMDGHLLFSQLQSQLPKQFSSSQEKFIKLVYDITSSSTFFGIDEFMTMSYLTNVVTSLSGPAMEAYDKIDFYHMRETILQYVELFQSVDRTHRGKISLSSLQDILSAALVTDFKTDTRKWAQITDVLEPSEVGQITKIEFLAYIPYFQTLLHK